MSASYMAKLKSYSLREGFTSGKMEKGQKIQLHILVPLYSGEKNETEKISRILKTKSSRERGSRVQKM